MDTTNMEAFGKYHIERSVLATGYVARIYNTNRKTWKAMLSIHAYRFSTAEKREAWIEEFKAATIKRDEMHAAYKAERKEANKALVPTQDLIGKIFYTSFGYDMTINEYVKVVEIKNKSVIAVEVNRSVANDDGRGAGRSYPSDVVKGEPFKCLVKKGYKEGDSVNLVGKGETWWEYEGNGNYYNTWD